MNPFAIVYDKLWELALSHPKLAQLVLPGNRINYGEEFNRDPRKDNINTADLPELALIISGVPEANLHSTSCTTMIRLQYTFIVSTGDFRVTEYLHEVEWALFCALAGWKTVLSPLLWEDKTFVKKVTLAAVEQGFSDAERNRGIRGWSAAWSCVVDMHFSTSDLVAELTEES